ncbi:hypothetical protein ARMGADRAFT_1019694 [Armillaria gallica]|uniref:Uncharacterized protein n=1 Tax=Armillaria gallica TaxID=47427 RepID=A0A2H3CGY5_ARMGA|nr:hypothetical protein ARMGADRAFT_1019694 [Armillaria gallica]
MTARSSSSYPRSKFQNAADSMRWRRNFATAPIVAWSVLTRKGQSSVPSASIRTSMSPIIAVFVFGVVDAFDFRRNRHGAIARFPLYVLTWR